MTCRADVNFCLHTRMNVKTCCAECTELSSLQDEHGEVLWMLNTLNCCLWKRCSLVDCVYPHSFTAVHNVPGTQGLELNTFSLDSFHLH